MQVFILHTPRKKTPIPPLKNGAVLFTFHCSLFTTIAPMHKGANR